MKKTNVQIWKIKILAETRIFLIFIAISSFDSNDAKSMEFCLNLSFDEDVRALEACQIFCLSEVVHLEVFRCVLAGNHLLKQSITVF